MKSYFHNQPIRALSWKQPFASLMLLGKIETRTWPTKYRGWVLICSSKVAYSEVQLFGISGEAVTQKIFVSLFTTRIKEIKGSAIAIGRLVDCRSMRFSDESKCYVKYYPDLYCHVYEDVRAIKPFTWKGSQGWKKLSQDVINKIELL